MKILVWAIRLIIFLFLFAFALQNTESVNLRFVLGPVWQAPLVMVVLVFFAGGAFFGMLTLLSVAFNQRREIARLKRQCNRPLSTAEIPPVA